MSRLNRTPVAPGAARAPKRTRRTAFRGLAVAAAAIGALLGGSASAMGAPAGPASGPPPDQMALMSPAQQDAVMHPLNTLANALTTGGRTGEAASYAGLDLN